jgi:hypothetical protein
MQKILVIGCSLSCMIEEQVAKSHPKLWVNQLIDQTIGPCDIVNLSQPGDNNNEIFTASLNELLKNKYDLAIVQWTELERFSLKIGLELYHTRTVLKTGCPDVSVNSVTVPGSWLEKLGKNVKSISNVHWELLDLVTYTNTLIAIQEKIHCGKIIFVNGAIDIPVDFFQKKSIQTPGELSEFEQSLLSVPTRDDDNILKLYDRIHADYAQAGGMSTMHWLNNFDKPVITKDMYLQPHPNVKGQTTIADTFGPKLTAILNKNNS